MFIPNEQLDKETLPTAYHLTIWLFIKEPAVERHSLERVLNKEECRIVREIIFEKIQNLGFSLRAVNVGKRKIELIVDAPADTEKIINSVTFRIIEFLRKSARFSEKINLWQPQTKILNIRTPQNLETAIKSVKKEKELALRMVA